MRGFVVGTGRRSRVTFWRAARHITSFTAVHQCVFQKPDQLDWPDRHITVEPSLRPLVTLLRERRPNLLLVPPKV
jgi:hypothetical protein